MGVNRRTYRISTLRIFRMERSRLDGTKIIFKPCFSITCSDFVVSYYAPPRRTPISTSNFQVPSSVEARMQPSRLLLLYELSCTRIIPVGPHPTIEALFETKDNFEAHNEEGNAPTNGPKVALCLISIGNILKVRSKVRLQVSGVSVNFLRWFWVTRHIRKIRYSRNMVATHTFFKIRGIQSEK